MLLACSGPPSDESSKAAGGGRASQGDVDPGAGGDKAEPEDPLPPERVRATFLGDLPEIRKRRFVRVLVSYSKTNFFHDRAAVKGFEVELLQAWEKRLNKGAKTYERIRLVFIPTPFDRLLDDLRQGHGEIAAAGLTITPERAERVAFTNAYIPNVEEVVVHNRGVTDVSSLEELAGRRVLVRAGSSYVEYLQALNENLRASDVRPVEILEADRRLVTEDLLELVNAGAIEMTVADHHIAEAWAEVLPDIVVRKDLAIHSGGAIAWAVRKKNPQLLESLNAFIRGHRKGSLMGNILFKRYYAKSKWIANPTSPAERAKLEKHITLFQKYAEQYGFDWLELAAQAYQESGIDQSVKSRAGAVGVMQIKPSTAADKNVNVPNIHVLENNIHAGTKYLAFLRDRYFDDPAIEPDARVDFALAAYNAGPARIRKLRQKAAERGLDSNKWFFNVEKIAAEEIGRETVDYVANVNKYYLAYSLQYEATRLRETAKAEMTES
jgi:membrane-bound lytic murein transglycosylase MltF